MPWPPHTGWHHLAMFTAHHLTPELEELRDELLPSALVLECEQEFEAMPEDWVYELALITESFDPLSHPEEWIPTDAPPSVGRLADGEPSIGMPGDGGISWTAQTEPPLVFLKPRLQGVPEGFRDFLIAEALLQCSLGLPEEPVGWLGEEYPAFQEAAGGAPDAAYRLAAALMEGWNGLETRDHFATWESGYPGLHHAWVDAGDRLVERIDSLPRLVANGTLSFVDATELACSAIKHELALPSPYDALDEDAFREHGPAFAIRWTAETVGESDGR